MNIEIRTVPGRSGEVIIDGIKWGWLDRTSHGSRGYSVIVRDMSYKPVTGTIHSAKIADREAARSGEASVPFETRLIEAVQKAIAEERLLHPDVLKARKAEKEAKEAKRKQDIADKERAQFEAKADEVLASLPGGRLEAQELRDLRRQIVEAMYWARAQY